ncbi:MAG: flagellar basal body rod protein FlgB [Bdellovibrionaceae bacterium]|nr:flagellar basal body rod protein FlgB [Pseudobdellovibrionaceae bacterium]MDW8190726.1 flagellar basal body rod protein FlgB [Pseudobdellovibrionaceae bacterium]
MSKIFDKTLDGLEVATQYRDLKHKIVSSNIANSETPNYKAKKIDFEQALKRQLDLEKIRQLSASHPNHIPVGGTVSASARAEIYEDPDGPVSNDGNTVDLEKEMTRLAENQIQYKTLIQLINKKLASLKYAVGEGR